jgi:hypothetical protein
MSKLTNAEKGETGEEQSQEHKGIVNKEFILASKQSIPHNTMKSDGNSVKNKQRPLQELLGPKGLAAASRRHAVSLLSSPGNF